MTEYTSFGDWLKATANAIKDKKGTTDKIKPINFPEEIANIESGSGANVVTVSFYNYDGKLLYQKPTIKGDDCVDVVAKGLLETPTRESDVQYHYSFKGWSKINDNSVDTNVFSTVNEDVNLYACYTSNVRYYNQYFYDGGSLLETLSCAYGSVPNPAEPFKENYAFINWTPELAPVTGETTYYAQFEYDDGYIKDDWEVISANVANGTYKNKYEVGDMKQAQITYDNVTYTIDFEIIEFDHDNLSDKSGKAGITFLAKQAIPDMVTAYNDAYAYWSWGSVKPKLESAYANLESNLKSVIKTVIKSDAKYNPATVKELNANLWLLSTEELNQSTVNTNSISANFTNTLNDYDEPYAIFDSNESRIRNHVNDGTPCEYVTRTTYYNSGAGGYTRLCYINTKGEIAQTNCKTAINLGIVIGFCI